LTELETFELPGGGRTYNRATADRLWRLIYPDSPQAAEARRRAQPAEWQTGRDKERREEQRRKRRLLHEERNELRRQFLVVLTEHGPDAPLWYMVHNTDLTATEVRMAGAFLAERGLITRRHVDSHGGFRYTITTAGREALGESMSRFYDTSAPDAPKELKEYAGQYHGTIRVGDHVVYENPALLRDGVYFTGGMDPPLVVTEIIDFGDFTAAVLNDGEWECQADNLRTAGDG